MPLKTIGLLRARVERTCILPEPGVLAIFSYIQYVRRRTTPNREPFRFLDLPHELCNMVYGYALRYDFCRDLFSYDSRYMLVRYQDTRTEAGHYRALVTSCRQIYLETKTLLTTLNTFVIHRIEVKDFSRARVIDSTRLAAVRHVKLWAPLGNPYATRMPGLQVNVQLVSTFFWPR